MLRILAISSQVACGHVGLSAIMPAAQALGSPIIALPSIILSNHPGHPHVAGERVSPQTLEKMFAALDDNGWLGDIDRVLTGYLPSAEHVAFTANVIARVKTQSPGAEIICDPVIGDELEGVYIDIEAARAIRDRLLPLADMILPNAFELSWLTDTAIENETAVLHAKQTLDSQTLADIAVLVTSVPTAENGLMANVFCPRNATHTLSHTDRRATSCRFTVHPNVPKGTGDFFSGLIAAATPFELATARTSALAAASIGKPHLAIAEHGKDWLNAKAFPAFPITA
ncbi:MAG: bifunctional hydroxymethylpyrimidine kinase/phosphomethylpyrimidine kinase [Pseudomonadota bacterium]